MNFRRYIIFLLLIINWQAISAQNDISVQTNDGNLKFRAVAELGFLAVLDHKIQFGQNGTYLDYVNEGGQSTLFPLSRLSLELEFLKKNTLIFLYQPLTIKTTALLSEDLIVDNLIYPAGSGVDFLYNFPFYRMSYLRELLSGNEKYSFGIGGTLQIRNATISFESTDGTRFRTNTDIGIVPALKIRGRSNFTDRFYGEIEADGIYAPVSYLNGSTNEITGAILDASIRIGYEIDSPVNAFLNIRYLGGGAVGTSSSDLGPGDGYTRNWLHFLTVSAGCIYEFE